MAAAGLDLMIYLDAEEPLLEAWFEARLVEFWRAAETDPASFYAQFRHMDETHIRPIARGVWRRINQPKLPEHISGGRGVADIVVTKGQDHQILAVTGA